MKAPGPHVLWIVVRDPDLASEELARYRRDLKQYGELWVEHGGCPRVCALFSKDRAWMMYMRNEDDAGFSTRNPSYDGPDDAVLRFVLENGQVDEYPASWTYPKDVVFRALEQFIRTGAAPAEISWHNDSGDGSESP